MSRASGANPRAMAGQLADDASEVDLSAELQVRTDTSPQRRCRRNALCCAVLCWWHCRAPLGHVRPPGRGFLVIQATSKSLALPEMQDGTPGVR